MMSRKAALLNSLHVNRSSLCLPYIAKPLFPLSAHRLRTRAVNVLAHNIVCVTQVRLAMSPSRVRKCRFGGNCAALGSETSGAEEKWLHSLTSERSYNWIKFATAVDLH